LNSVKASVQELGLKPQLQVIKSTPRADSDAYIKRKRSVLGAVGIDCIIHDLSLEPPSALLQRIKELNAHEEVKAILVQLPLSDASLESSVINLIDPKKDVDGFHPSNLLSRTGLTACTAAGIMALLHELKVDFPGLKATVVGKSRSVGLPISLKLLEAGATVTICHRNTLNLIDACRGADLLIVAVGSPGLIGAEHVKSGAVVIDVGINVVGAAGIGGRRRIVGDVRFDEVRKVASFVTPVPGGVGLLTVACLARNVLRCYNE
jgi:methylenetetrahydrofolate dehydrogenase (NADP+)/methenyltetrahydrofolate cyclohydrolase